MKILHVIASVDPRHGGPLDSVNSISSVWSRQNHVCHIASLDEPSDPWVTQSVWPVFALGAPRKDRWPGSGYRFSARLHPWLRQNGADYDAAIIHGLWNYASLGGWRGLEGGTTPYFVFPHGMLDPWFNKTFPLKAIYKSLFWRLFENRVLRDAAGVLFTAEEERLLASRSFQPYVAKPYVVGLGTRDVVGDADAQRRAFVTRMPELAHRRFILFLGRIHPKKGIDLLIRGFARLAESAQDVDLVVAGPDQVGLQRELQDLAREVGVATRVHWPGMLTGDVKVGAFRSAEFFALTSHQENFGIAVAEALVVGTPVLITNKVNIWREIESDGAGFVVNDDVEDVTRGLAHLVGLDADRREEMRARARACFRQRYDIEVVATELLRICALGRRTGY